MFVDVKRKKKQQTEPCHLSGSLSAASLNMVEKPSVAQIKTSLNSSRGGRSTDIIQGVSVAHNANPIAEHGALVNQPKLKQNVVFVIGQNKKPLMPTNSTKARHLLKSGLAKVSRREPFTIKLLVETKKFTQKVVVGIDVGSKVIGSSAIANGVVLYAGETVLRTNISEKMEQRAMYRRTRRARKTRYRQARFNNRTRVKGWLTPTMRSKVQAHEREIKFIKSILPCSLLIIETASFDIHKITNPTVSRFTYQSGRQKDFYNVKAFVLSRDGRVCQKCSGKHKCEKLHVHHILFRSNGGTDSPDNLITLCETCHNNLHKKSNAQAESDKLQKKRRANTTDATQVSTVSAYLRNKGNNDCRYKFTETFGYITKFNRENLGLPKEHFVDAVCIAGQGEILSFDNFVFVKKVNIPKGDYKQTNGKRSEKKLPTGKLFGLRKFDKISTSKGIGFVKGKRSSGNFSICDINNNSITDSVSVKKDTKRITSRGSFLMEARFLHALKDVVSSRKIR